MTGTSGTLSGGLRKSQTPCELLGGLSGFLSRRCSRLRPCVESVLEPEDSSPVLTWILGYCWSIPRGVTPRLEWGHAQGLLEAMAGEEKLLKDELKKRMKRNYKYRNVEKDW